MNQTAFTPSQIVDYHCYEKVRAKGKYNMFDPRARAASGLSREEYTFVMQHYSELREAADKEQQS